MRIVIADSSESFCEALKLQVSHAYDVWCYHDGAQLPLAIAEIKPDILVLDLMMPRMDGLSLLNAITFAGMQPKILATTFYMNEYIQDELKRFSVEYVLLKPCAVCLAVARLNDLIMDLMQSCTCKPDINKELNSLLLSLSFRTNISGYSCLLEAVSQMYLKRNLMLTKELYPIVAHNCGGSVSRVEKAIRDAIVDAWKHRDDKIWNLYFSLDRNGLLRCPTNGDFIARIVHCMDNVRKIV